MRRRQFLLGTVAVTGAVAGCTGSASDESPTNTPSGEIEPVPEDSTPSYQFQQGPRNSGIASGPLDADSSWWETQIDPVDLAFGAADGRVVAGSSGMVRVFSADTGEQVWEEHLGAMIFGIPALADDTAYVPFPYIGLRPLGASQPSTSPMEASAGARFHAST